MRLLCNGVALDLESGATMAFKKSNPLFAFDALTCERTQSFSLPSTPTNESVLGLAKIPAYRGDGMRRRFDAELQDGTVVKRGYLYVDRFDKERYNAIFVTGVLVGLQDIKNVGKIAEAIACDDVVEWREETTPSLPARADMAWGQVNYRQVTEPVHPSYLLCEIVDRVVRAHNLPAINIPASALGLRIVKGEIKPLKRTSIDTIRSYAAGYVDPTAAELPTVNGSDIVAESGVGGLFGRVLRTQSWRTHRQELDQRWHTYVYSGKVSHYQARQHIKLTFPEDFPEDVYVGRFANAGYFEDSFEFYGGREFRATPTGYERDGEPLAGRSIELERGQDFIFIRESDYTYGSGGEEEFWTQGYRVNNALTIRCTAEGSDIEVGDYVRLQDNLPDSTLVDLLKAVSVLTGKLLNYTDAEGVTFDELEVDGWDVRELRDIVSVGEVARTFGDYAQSNIIRYDSDEKVSAQERMRSVYVIHNDNIEAEKDLQVIPWSEGGVYSDDIADVVNVKDGTTNDTVADTHTASTMMARTSIPRNANLQALCDASTSVIVSARMTLADFDRLTAKTVILMRNTRYVWTEATWAKGIAQLKISKIDS